MDNYRIHVDERTVVEILHRHVLGFMELEEVDGSRRPSPPEVEPRGLQDNGFRLEDVREPRPIVFEDNFNTGPPETNSGLRYLVMVGRKSIRIPDTEFSAWQTAWNTARGNRAVIELPGSNLRMNQGRFGMEPIKRYVFLLDQIYSYEIANQLITINLADNFEIEVTDPTAKQKFLDTMGAS